MNITWKIINLEWIEEVQGNQKVVTNVHYWVDAVDDQNNMGYVWGNVQLDIDDLSNFSDFNTLDEQTCIGWVKSKLDNLYSGNGVSMTEQAAVQMCLEQDPLRKRGFGVPW